MLAAGCWLDRAGTGGLADEPLGGGGAATSVGPGGAPGGMGGAGGGGFGGDVPAVCGDGVIDPGEACDDGNDVAGDGCAACALEAGYTCSGEPSSCEPIEPQVVDTGTGLGVVVADDESYDGSLETMDCVDLVVDDEGHPTLQWVEVQIAMDHTYVGDLVMKLESPAKTVLTLMSRPGLDEPRDTSNPSNGDSSNLSARAPIRFADGAPHDAETMGAGITNGSVVCLDDDRCDYFPNPGAGPGETLSDFVGEDPAGTWRLCVADGDDNVQGTIDRVVLTVMSW